MHVHELNPKKTLVVLLIFVAVIITGFLTMTKPLLTYHKDMKQSLQTLKDKNAFFYPYQLADVINNKNKDVVLIDIRNKFAFSRGHIPGAKSISAFGLTNKENVERLKDYKKNGITVVLYGKNQLQANGPWMLFRETGFNNVRILLGGYDYYLAHKNNLAKTKSDNSYIKGIPRYDFAKVAKTSVAVSEKEQKSNVRKPLVIRRKKKAVVASGGC